MNEPLNNIVKYRIWQWNDRNDTESINQRSKMTLQDVQTATAQVGESVHKFAFIEVWLEESSCKNKCVRNPVCRVLWAM